ncbi:probable serine/threonine-protein kinase DDB_G0282963 isoform X2 [Contarinia nasturtii]|uniref:probable serine/threonine-protein kinase DDB_G0282963 isoform X2 n=1 Tax=Contarinia nasturtii TaxID=265458 RepID=UPI0012D3C2C7|nr:probable serine/threonine-protein kinase DDB_G0282963 isoform X2 [Contarinia nasturtii]
MDNLDISDSLSSSFPWLPYGASQFDYQNGDLSYFSQRSAMLEPIIEETSDDDDVSCGHVWTHNENQWSSESDAGSVIRVELIQEADTISERDFACPPKRRKQEENDEDTLLKKSTSLNDDYKYRIDLLEPTNADAFTKRFCIDPVNFDRFSDPDSLSFNSLSRSSSLIQFESLERQIQTGDTFGGSSPFLNNLAPPTATTTPQETSNKVVEFIAPKTNENAHDTNNTSRNYYDIEKIDFNSALFLNCQEQTSSSESSYSTDNSIYYSDNQTEIELVAKDTQQRQTQNVKMAFRNKNSVENLSEDSGYGEFPSIKCRSKSIPNLNQDQLIEEDEDLDNHRSLNNISNSRNLTKVKINSCTGINGTTNNNSSKINTNNTEIRRTDEKSTFGVSKNNSRNDRCDWSEHVFTAPTNTNGVSSKKSASYTSLQNTQSASLPDISSHFADDYDTNESIFYCDTTNSNRKSKRNTVCGDLLSETVSLLQKDSFNVASVPNNLNIFASQCSSNGDFDVTSNDNWISKNPRHTINSHWQEPTTTNAESIASRNFDLTRTFGVVDYHCTITPPSSSSQQTFQQQKIINSSYSNLTLLDYSGSTKSIRNQLRAMAENQKRHSLSSNRSSNGSITTGSTEFSKCNFLLDEISAHFDKNLSILNDKGDFEDEPDNISHSVKELIAREIKPPQPPPRRQLKKCATKSERDAKTDSTLLEKSNYTFDRDPTNLKTCYAESLERCNVDFQSSNSINLFEDETTSNNFSPVKHSTPAKREMVASTPNLIQHRSECVESDECLHSSSAYNSLNPLPQSEMPQTKGILSGGSRNSLGKGVSFYPYVSQISWLEQSSAEDAAEISDSEISDNHNNKSYNDTSNSSSNSNTSNMILPSTEQIQSNNDSVNNNISLTNTLTGRPTVTSSSSTATTTTQINTHTNETYDTNDSSVVDSSDDDLYYETQPRSLAALAERDRRREQLYLQKLAKKQQKDQQQQHQSVNTSTDRNVLVDSRDGMSIQANAIDSSSAMIVNANRVSVESNNVNRISCGSNDINNRLSAEQKLNNNNNKTTSNKSKISCTNYPNNKTDLRENCSNRISVGGGGSGVVLQNGSGDSETDNTINQKQPIKMETNKSNVSAINVPVSSPQATSKSASLPAKMNNFDKKSAHKPGFLSRFTNFRFSLRGSKKKLKSLENTPSNATNNIVLVSTKSATAQNNNQHGESVVDHVPLRNKTNNNSSRAGCYQRNSMRSNEFEYIPLKDPIAVVFDTPNQTSDKNVGNVTTNNTSTPINATKNATKNFKNDNNNSTFIAAEKKNNVVTSKPPLPRQPPRVVGVCAKQASTLNSTHPSYYQQSNNKAATLSQSNPQREGVKRHAQQQRSTSVPPREINFNSPTDNGKNFHYLANHHHDDDDYQLLSSRQTNESYSRGGLLKGAVSSDGLLMDVNENSFCTGDEDEDDDSKIGLIETNLDTDETIISGKTRSLMELGPQMANRSNGTAANIRLGKHGAKGNDPTTIEPRRPHKSMEFLLDKENQRFVLPPENELQKSHDTNTNYSEHQLRVQASLQRLHIPDWFKQYSTATKTGENTGGYVPGSFTKKRNADTQRWTGLSSKTTSLSSLGSHRSDRSPLLLSPSAQSHHGGHTGFSRWSTSHLNSSQTSPSASTRGSFSRGGPNSSILSNQSYANNSIRGSFRQPYLGWRSQEKLSQPRTPHERLASSMLSRQQTKQQPQTQSNNTNALSAKTATEPAVSPEIQTSIKEVTSAIVHYVNDTNNRTTSGNSRSRSASPSSRHCWLESSFVGNKPMDSPQTPVLDSSIGLSATSSRVNGVGDTNVINDSCRLTIEAQPLRRRSESDAAKRPDSTAPDNNDLTAQLRRVSLDSTESKSATTAAISSAEMIKCRNPKCDAAANAADAKRNYKSCHNCTQMYCSRDCRRAHWEKHRKACLHSRVSVLCRQVLSACKDDNDTLSHLSILARRGYLTQGRGVVRILFRSPESAEVFVKQGFQRIGEASYVRWPELMPQEMGAELYSELLRLSTEYKPDSKMLIYVAICVVSEAPSSASSTSVKWERQLVSRCAKLKLSKTLPIDLIANNSANTMANTGHQRTTSNTSNSISDPLATIGIAEPTRVYTDVLILTFNMCDKTQNTPKNRELVLQNMQLALKKRGVSLRKHYPEIFQRLNSFVEGTTDRFMPVTLHPRDSSTGQPFICIMMPNHGETDRIKLPESDKINIVTIDCLEIDQSTLIE